jgi:non-ribosomal peptide synthetase component E (peptide arylation enzyme)
VQPPDRKKTPVWVVALVAALVALWLSGAADETLSKVGLNKNPCVKNAFGATFCGDDAERVCEQFGGPACADAGFNDEGSLSDQLEDEPVYDTAADDSGQP